MYAPQLHPVFTAMAAQPPDAGLECSLADLAIGVTAHGVEIFPFLPAGFYNAYLPIKYMENTLVVSPVDTSTFLVSFCLYPGKFNPSGYYNLSTGRELYINYAMRDTAFARDYPPGKAEMVVSMAALNFLVRKGDQISLRFSL